MYKYIYIYTYTYMYIHTYIYTYIHTYVFVSQIQSLSYQQLNMKQVKQYKSDSTQTDRQTDRQTKQ